MLCSQIEKKSELLNHESYGQRYKWRLTISVSQHNKNMSLISPLSMHGDR
ncbi:hypothetical protein Fmac_025831 [Flemingia macrophylla]|uniref:Ycf15 n=1 Tax=Flemingia macrophylla TaxID=520843 RepID=A0ABD1LD56_9FABA